MRKVITLGFVSVVSTLLLVGCSAKTSSLQTHETESCEAECHTGEMHDKNLTQEKVHKIIKEAGEENGWKMTEFKSNAMIAEKIDMPWSISNGTRVDKGGGLQSGEKVERNYLQGENGILSFTLRGASGSLEEQAAQADRVFPRL